MKNRKKSPEFSCTICDYITDNKSDYSKHLLTAKHKNRTQLNNFDSENLNKFVCKICQKQYKARNSLWYHAQKCDQSITDSSNNDFVFDKEFVMLILKQNTELQTQMMEQQTQMLEVIKNGTHNTTNNKTFNLQLFLNETCKDAMNIMDFVDSVKVQLCDLEKVGELGFVNGISNIIIKNLKDLDVTQRPVHCTDTKREVLYVKDEDKWEKEEHENKKLRKAIKHIAQKNSKLLSSFREKYPDCNKSDSKYSDKYNKVVLESFSGDCENENKIIKKISKEFIIDK